MSSLQPGHLTSPATAPLVLLSCGYLVTSSDIERTCGTPYGAGEAKHPRVEGPPVQRVRPGVDTSSACAALSQPGGPSPPALARRLLCVGAALCVL